jgi:tetratricopeptide (TPR) repeat protein
MFRFLFERGHFGQVAEMVETLQMVCLENQKALLATAIFIRAGLCADNNRVKEADLLIKRCVELREQILAPNDPDLGNTYYSAGIISMECDRHEESLDYHNKAMAVRKTCGDEDHTQTAVALQNLALLHVKTRNLDAAETCLDEAVQLCKASSGPESDRYAEYVYFQELIQLAANIKSLECCLMWEIFALPRQGTRKRCASIKNHLRSEQRSSPVTSKPDSHIIRLQFSSMH